MSRYLVTGTDTDVGKTVFAAALARHLAASYWKPVQAGTADGTDADSVRLLAGDGVSILPEAYVLTTPCAPVEAARIDGVTLDPARLALPSVDGPLVVEGAGGVLVPYATGLLAADLFARWGLPAILVARTALGTISHSLLSLEALRARGVTVHGIAFVGEECAHAEAAVVEFGKVRHLGRLPRIAPLTADTLAAAFAAGIRTELL